jgi:hypothetical protein
LANLMPRLSALYDGYHRENSVATTGAVTASYASLYAGKTALDVCPRIPKKGSPLRAWHGSC